MHPEQGAPAGLSSRRVAATRQGRRRRGAHTVHSSGAPVGRDMRAVRSHMHPLGGQMAGALVRGPGPLCTPRAPGQQPRVVSLHCQPTQGTQRPRQHNRRLPPPPRPPLAHPSCQQQQHSLCARCPDKQHPRSTPDDRPSGRLRPLLSPSQRQDPPAPLIAPAGKGASVRTHSVAHPIHPSPGLSLLGGPPPQRH